MTVSRAEPEKLYAFFMSSDQRTMTDVVLTSDSILYGHEQYSFQQDPFHSIEKKYAQLWSDLPMTALLVLAGLQSLEADPEQADFIPADFRWTETVLAVITDTRNQRWLEESVQKLEAAELIITSIHVSDNSAEHKVCRLSNHGMGMTAIYGDILNDLLQEVRPAS